MRTATSALPQLRIHFLEVAAVDQHLARLTAGAGRHEPFGFHHVNESRGAAEADAQTPLQVRDRRLSAGDHDARGLVVELVLVEVEAAGAGLLLAFSSDGLI